MSARIVDRERALAMHRQGYSTKDIAKKFGVRSPAITRILRSEGIVLRGKNPVEGQMDTLADHMANGLTFTEAAEAMGVTRQWVRRLWQRICEPLGWQAV